MRPTLITYQSAANIRLRLAALVFAIGVLLTSLTSATPQTEKLKDPQFIAEGAKTFATSCGNAYCHGTGGVGGGAPRLRGRGLESAYLFKTISNGIPGSSMLSFKSELSEEQIWELVAFVMSDAKSVPEAKSETAAPAKPSPTADTVVTSPASASSMTGAAQAGKALFFDSSASKSCFHCHSIGGEGTAIGPDLSKSASRPARELLISVILPRATKEARYATLRLTLQGGDKIVGIKKDEDAESIRVYDVTELPAVLRTIQKIDIVKSESTSESIMPDDYASRYTMKQLLDLVTFLKSFESKEPVTLKDLVQ